MSVPGTDAEMEMKTSNVQHPTSNAQLRSAFTLIELLVVITIIVVLMGLLFPAFRGVQDQAKRTQAKNDLTQIVTAVNAFYTEYGKYPLPAGAANDFTFGPGGDRATNEALFNPLRGLEPTLNPRQIVFLAAPDVKDPANPRSGIGTTTFTGQYFDPWGTNYLVRIDGDYENKVANPYTANAGAIPDLQLGVIAWSLGKDQRGGSGDKKVGTAEDDVISWQ
jgi:prepilin-type N-terminal cleavage/methylation domain-containing protein